jgi:tripartite motif-containing protein 71
MKKIIIFLIILVSLILIAGIFYFKSVRKMHEPQKLILKYTFGKKGEQGKGGEFYDPTGLAIRGDYLFVADTENNRIQVFGIKPDGNLEFKFIFGKEGKELGEFSCPSGLAINGNYLFVADGGNNRIQTININSDASLVAKSIFDGKNIESGKFLSSYSINLAINDTNLFISGGVSSKAQVFNINSDGTITPKFSFGKEGEGLGEFKVPDGIAIKDKYLYVGDSINYRIQVFKINPDGTVTPKSSFGKEGKSLGEFGKFENAWFPEYINLIIKDNYLYATDSNNYRIQVFKINSNGSLSPKFTFGKGEKGYGDFGIPYGLAIKDNYLYVSDAGMHRIQILEIKY